MTGLFLGAMTVGGLLVAIVIGQRIASNDYKSIGLLLGVCTAIVVALVAGDKYWVLIPALSPAIGGIRLIPIPFSYSELAAIGAIGMYFIYLAFKKARFGIRVKTVDLIMYVSLIYLITVWVRNPAGFLFVRTEMIGGRPYFIIFIAFLAYVVLANHSADQKLGRALIYIMAIPAILVGCLNGFVSIFPESTRYILPFYGGIDVSGLADNFDAEQDGRRLTGLADIANPIIKLLVALYPASTLVLPIHIGRFILFFGSLILIGLSGFRNYYVAAMASLLVASGLRKRWTDIIIVGVVGTVSLSGIIVLQGSGVQMPFAIQRAFSMLPLADWDPAAKADADASTEWRMDMWKDAWETPGIMRDKLLGDGFGFRLEEMAAIQESLLNQGMGFAGRSQYEAHLIMGSYHSGPLNTIKRVGFIGLGILVLWFFFQTREILRLMARAWGTPYQNWSLFLTIPAVYAPFNFFFIYGSYETALPGLIYSLGYYKLLENSLNRYQLEQASAVEKESSPPPNALSN